MSDVINSRSVLQIVQGFSDGDDRTMTIDNPRSDVSPADLTAVQTYIKNNNLVLGDKNGAAFTNFKSAKKITQTTRYLDLND